MRLAIKMLQKVTGFLTGPQSQNAVRPEYWQYLISHFVCVCVRNMWELKIALLLCSFLVRISSHIIHQSLLSQDVDTLLCPPPPPLGGYSRK